MASSLGMPNQERERAKEETNLEKRLITRFIKSGCYIPGYSVDQECSRITPQPLTKYVFESDTRISLKVAISCKMFSLPVHLSVKTIDLD